MSIETKETKQVNDLTESIILSRYYGDNTIMKYVSNDVESDKEAARELFAHNYKNYVPKYKIERSLDAFTDFDRETIIEYAIRLQLELMKED
jgi:hypothetical protein